MIRLIRRMIESRNAARLEKELEVILRTSERVQRHIQTGLTLEEAVNRACSEMTAEDLRIFKRKLKRNRKEARREREARKKQFPLI